MYVTKKSLKRWINNVSRFGAIAQLVEYLHGMQGVSGSSPLGSIKIFLVLTINLKDNHE